ncbi:hypothetical protein, partial [Mesorhizobium sp. M8A.F.Ca.ET.167.01.1.1]|uniref:hypothetical protein n=1 Tax=Mesorhizobium sp. M8A.F.Ca.ET.167.01.1.1 TaxID=2563961 RepID=UPI001AED4169
PAAPLSGIHNGLDISKSPLPLFPELGLQQVRIDGCRSRLLSVATEGVDDQKTGRTACGDDP